MAVMTGFFLLNSEYFSRLLVTECEIFLSLIVKFLDPDKPAWQRSLALELIHRMVVQPRLLRLVEVAIFIDTWH